MEYRMFVEYCKTGKHPDLKRSEEYLKRKAKKDTKIVEVRRYRTPAAQARAIKAGLHRTSKLGPDYNTRQLNVRNWVNR